MLMRIPALFLLAALSACGLPQNVVVLIPDEGGTVGKILVEHDNKKDELSVPYSAEATDARATTQGVFTTSKATVDAEFAGALADTPRKPAIYVIYFLSGDREPDPHSVDTMKVAIEAATTTKFADISVVGHSDSVGDDSANFVLSMYRAQAVRAALVSGGVSPSIIDLDYHGSNNPRVARPRGTPEPENRRVEVTIR
jgi:outer membrane protein OmpA-like peptidoglycan-associated protein